MTQTSYSAKKVMAIDPVMLKIFSLVQSGGQTNTAVPEAVLLAA